MKYVVLLLKFAVFVSLILIRLGEWDINWVFEGSKYRESLEYYTATIATIAIFLMFLDFVQFFTVWWYRRRHKVRVEDNFIIGVSHIYSLLLGKGRSRVVNQQ